MEELVVDPIEDKVNELENIKKIISNIDDGVAVLRVDFTYDSDPEDKYEELLREINNLRPTLPEGLYDLEVQRITPSDVNILQVALVSETAPYNSLETQAEKLQERLEKIKSLKNVDTWAYPERQVRVSLDLQKMAQRRLSLGRVLGAIGSENANIPAAAWTWGPCVST
jgi:multidrug efflux pump subunit AcrB